MAEAPLSDWVLRRSRCDHPGMASGGGVRCRNRRTSRL